MEHYEIMYAFFCDRQMLAFTYTTTTKPLTHREQTKLKYSLLNEFNMVAKKQKNENKQRIPVQTVPPATRK